MKQFIGRKKALESLENLIKMSKASLVVMKGRRRIGKSRLAEEFGKNKVFLPFSGIAPIKGITAQDQRDAFAKQLSSHFHLPKLSFDNWSDVFSFLSTKLSKKPTVILFDEISWMSSKDPTFIPKLKLWWDHISEKYQHLVFILCGSVSTWIDKNIINSTAFFGRISQYIELHELSLPECFDFLQKMNVTASHLDIFKILAVTGGIPWYLEQIDSHQSVDANIKRLCFEKGGILVLEFDQIFHDLFSSRGSTYKKIIEFLAEGMKDLSEIRSHLQYAKSGSLSKYINALKTSGFITQHEHWSFKTGIRKRQTLYRLSDNYLRFYLRYIEPNLSKIEKDAFSDTAISALPGWDVIDGFQIENVLLKIVAFF